MGDSRRNGVNVFQDGSELGPKHVVAGLHADEPRLEALRHPRRVAFVGTGHRQIAELPRNLHGMARK